MKNNGSVGHLRYSTVPEMWLCGAGLSFLGLSPPSPAEVPSRSPHVSSQTETLQVSRSVPFLCLRQACLLFKGLVARGETLSKAVFPPLTTSTRKYFRRVHPGDYDEAFIWLVDSFTSYCIKFVAWTIHCNGRIIHPFHRLYVSQHTQWSFRGRRVMANSVPLPEGVPIGLLLENKRRNSR